MLSIKIFFTLFFIGLINTTYSQEYETYKVHDSIPNHSILINNDTLSVKVKHTLLTGAPSVNYNVCKQKDTLHVLEMIIPEKITDSIPLPKDYIGVFLNNFENSKFHIKSDNELQFIGDGRPYFKKQFVDSVMSNNLIYYVNGKLFKVPESIPPPIDEFNKELKNPKKTEFKLLDGKKAYEKYGVIGLHSVFEYSDKKKPSKK